MADSMTVTPVLSVCATTDERIDELTIKDGQLIFVQDTHKVALDFNGKRKFYEQIKELETELERISLLAPVFGMYYFVVETAMLWTYRNEWIQLTSKPEEIVFIGTELPESGKEQMIYVTTIDGDESISIWDKNLNAYKVVADKTQEALDEDIKKLFE